VPLPLLQTAVGKSGDNALLRKKLGDLYRMSDQFEKARDAYLMALDLGLIRVILIAILAFPMNSLNKTSLPKITSKPRWKKIQMILIR
jgi:hypothetical protein